MWINIYERRSKKKEHAGSDNLKKIVYIYSEIDKP